jgi:sulfatase maturation enzyme AslB (radical SAM superfamily)
MSTQSEISSLNSTKLSSEAGKTLCALPWVHSFISEVGHSFPCCISTDESLPNVNQVDEAYDMSVPENFEAAWNSDYMKQLRLDMMAQRRPKPCMRCYKLEDLGIRSSRLVANEMWGPQLEEALQSTAVDGSALPKFYSADFRLGNNCNLRCRMCSPVSSKALAADWEKAELISKEEKEYFLSLNWFENPKFWDMFSKYSNDLKSLHFAGGEPFLIKEHFAFLKGLIERDVAKSLVLSYNTNLTVLPEELLELWKNFKGIELLVSLDGTEQINHYIRYPSNWSVIQKNIRFIHDHMSEYKIEELAFNVTVQMYNIFDLTSLINFLVKEYPKAKFPILSPLFGPQELSIQVLPPEMKSALTEFLKKYVESKKESWSAEPKPERELKRWLKNIDGILNFLNKEDKSNLLPAFKTRTRVFDNHRGQSCPTVIKELAPLFI